MKFLTLSLLVLAGYASADPVTRPEDMHSFTLNGFTLTGAEYWVTMGTHEPDYPLEILWGFMGESMDTADGGSIPTPANLLPTEAALNCAVQAYNKLDSLLQNPPAEFTALLARGATNRFYLWVNDYTRADSTMEVRANRMWHWNRGEHNYSLGYWKWESSVNQAGECLIPQDAQIMERIAQAAREMP